jgi:hypothetical protein
LVHVREERAFGQTTEAAMEGVSGTARYRDEFNEAV